MGKDTVQLETAVSTISQEYLLEFTLEYGISEALHPELPGPEDRIVDFPEGKVGVYTKSFEFANFRLPLSQFLFDILGYYQNNRFFWVDERVFPTIVDWRTSAPNDGMPAENTYSPEAVRVLDTHRTPIQKQPEALLCLVGLSRRYYLGDKVYPTFLHDDDRVALNDAHEVSLLTVTANRMIEIEDPVVSTDSSGVPSTIERSPLDFANENPSEKSTGPEDHETAALEVLPPENVNTIGDAPEAGPVERVAAADPPAAKERRKRGQDVVDTNAPLKALRRDHADPRPTGGTRGGKSLASIELGMGSTRPTPAPQGAPADVSDPNPLSFADPRSSKGATAAGDPESENTSFASMVGSPESIYRPEWGITNGSMLDTPEACHDLVDHVAMGSELRLKFEQEAKLLKKFVAQVARRDKRIQARENEIKNLETLLEAEADMKKAAKDKSAKLSQELEHMRALFSDLQVSNNRLSQQGSTLQEQVSGEEKLKAAFEEFKQYEDNRVEQHCTEIDARLDALSIDFDEELYPHMLTAIAGRRWMIGHWLRLAVMKCGKSIELRQAFADVVSAGIAKGMMDQLEGLKDAPMDVIMASLHLESDTRYDTLQWVRELRSSSSQLMIPVYPEVRDPLDPWACKEEILLSDAIVANVSRAKKKKKCRVADAATQTETSNEASPQLLTSSSLPVIHS
nr:putative transposase (putative), gypsy type [Tanacetum cinerariifolium]